MDIKQIHDDILFLLKKEQNGYVSHQKIDDSLDRASLELFNERWKIYAIDQKAQDDLAPFKTKLDITNANSVDGIITIGATYLRFLSMWYSGYDNVNKRTTRKGIEIVNDDELAERLESQLIPVTNSRPVAQWIGKGKLQLYPKVPTAGELWYMKRPAKPVFAYTQAGRVITYNPGGSTQLEWDDSNISKIMLKTLAAMGVHMSYDQLMQYSEAKDKQIVE